MPCPVSLCQGNRDACQWRRGGGVGSGYLFKQQYPRGRQCVRMPVCCALHGAGAASSPAQRDQGCAWQLGSSAVRSDEKPGEHEGQPAAGPGMGGQRQQEGLAHLGEWTVWGEKAMGARAGRGDLTTE